MSKHNNYFTNTVFTRIKGREYNKSAYNNEAMEKYISGKVNRYSNIYKVVGKFKMLAPGP